MMIFDPALPGYGIFSLEGLAILLGAFCLLSAVHPGLIAVTRLSAALRGIAMPHDGASCGGLTAGFILHGPSTLPGYAVFAASLCGLLFPLTPASPADGLAVLMTMENGLSLLVASGLGLAFLSGMIELSPATWRFGPAASLAWVLRMSLLASFAITCVLSAALIPSLMAFALLFGARIAGGLIGRAIYLYGGVALFTAPFMLLAWVCVTIAISIIGPLERLLRPLTDRPGSSGLAIGLRRSQALKSNAALLGPCASLDSIAQARLPR